jgi:hypothetical protein
VLHKLLLLLLLLLGGMRGAGWSWLGEELRLMVVEGGVVAVVGAGRVMVGVASARRTRLVLVLVLQCQRPPKRLQQRGAAVVEAAGVDARVPTVLPALMGVPTTRASQRATKPQQPEQSQAIQKAAVAVVAVVVGAVVVGQVELDATLCRRYCQQQL